MTSIKVEKTWGYPTYYFNDKKLDEKKDGTLILSNGMKIKFKSVSYNSSYFDMGNTYEFEGYQLIGEIPFNENFIKVDIIQLKDIEEIYQ